MRWTSAAIARYCNDVVLAGIATFEGLAWARRRWEGRAEARDGALRRLVTDHDGVIGDAAAADVIVASAARRRESSDLAVRRSHATFRVDLRERNDAVRVIADRILPVA